MVGFGEILILLLALGLVLFGAKKIPEFAKQAGRFSGEVKKGKQEIEKELREGEKQAQGEGEKQAQEKTEE